MVKIRINSKLCDGCGICVAVCPSYVLVIKGIAEAENPEACLGIRAKQLCSTCIATEEVCMGCVACVRNCPYAAIEILEV